MIKRLSAMLAAWIMVLATLACAGAAAPTAAPSETPVLPTATNTAKPTATSKPSATPDTAATQRVSDFNSVLQDYKTKGYIATTSGAYSELDPFKEEWAQLGYFNWWLVDGQYKDFVFKAHLTWSTASPTPEISGCGIVFGLHDNGDYYAVFLDKSRILFILARGSHIYNVGKTRGSGRNNFGNPAEADFAVAINSQSAFVSVNGDVTEYTLSADQSSAGKFGLTLLSGTNHGYGTRCEMNDLVFWTED